MRQMGSVNRLPPDVPSLEDGIIQRSESLEERIHVSAKKTKLNGSRSGNHIE